MEGSINFAVFSFPKKISEGIIINDFDHNCYRFNIIIYDSTHTYHPDFTACLRHRDSSSNPQILHIHLAVLRNLLCESRLDPCLVPQESSSYLIQSIVKLLGYGVVVGASIVKLPQIIKIIKRKSAVGVSFSSTIL